MVGKMTTEEREKELRTHMKARLAVMAMPCICFDMEDC